MTKIKLSVLAILFIALSTLTFVACTNNENQIEKNQDPLVNKFLDSKTFLNHKDEITKYGTVSYSEIKSAVISIENDKITVLSIPIKDGNITVGTIEAVDLQNTSYLPNGDTYALNYINLTKFNSKTLTGQIQMADLNFDNFVHSNISVEKNKIKSWKCTGLSEKLSKKYSLYRNSNKRNALVARHLCDGNNNGDVSFSECYKCVADAIAADGFSSWVCDFPVAGWLSCWGTSTATCVYISANN